MSDLPAYAEPWLEGRVLLIDKPYGWTSFDAVKHVRGTLQKALRLRKIKVGHAGTLDPLATGLLVICTGRATKDIATYTAQQKAYTGTLLLGSTTPSYDLETEVENHLPTGHISAAQVAAAAAKLTGTLMQVPPVYSAKWVDGKRAYDTARKGETVDIPAAEVQVYRFATDGSHLPEVQFEISCSKGTYIRALARDLGELLGCGAHLTALRRIQSGAYDVDNALSPQAFRDLMALASTKAVH
jgi:tRNA pseudouridine55 synthase